MKDPATLYAFLEDSLIPEKLKIIIKSFMDGYLKALSEKVAYPDKYQLLIKQYIGFVEKQLKDPFKFELFHKRITHPVDYYHFGLEFFRPLIIFNESKFIGKDKVDTIIDQVKNGDNVILFANHQTEPDPQAISLLIDSTHPKFAEEIIFVAGHRVTTDPLAVPLTMGRNLLCIYSKKRIQNHPERKEEMLSHNHKTMQVMAKLLKEGGKCIYVAPSGGRDRPDENGHLDVAPFDPRSIEMFRLMAIKSHTKTHYYPLSLYTYHMLPPPNSISPTLSEERSTSRTPIHIAFGEELDLDKFEMKEKVSKNALREFRAEYIWQKVRENYQKLTGT